MSRRAVLLAGSAIVAPVAWTIGASAVTAWWLGVQTSAAYPTTEWFTLFPYREQGAVAKALLLGAAAATLGLAGMASALRETLFPKEPLHGISGWLTKAAAKAATKADGGAGYCFSRKPRPDTIVIGMLGWGPFKVYVGLAGEEHGALTAKTRSGKGVSVVVPNALNTGGSLLCFSVKRDVWEDTAAERAAKGDDVFVFDLSDPERRTHRWNPLGYVRRGHVETYGDIYRAMWFLIPETKSPNPFWDNAARKLASAAAVIYAETPRLRLNVAEVLGAFQREDWAEHVVGLLDEAVNAGRPCSKSAARVIRGMAQHKDEKTAHDVISTITTALGLWDDPVVAAVTAESDFDLGAIRSKRMSVFVCGGPADIRIYRPIYGLLFQQFVQLNTRVEFGKDPAHLPDRVLGILDEFWALGKQDVLADAAAFTASFGFRWLYVQQSENQSVTAFGKEGADNLFTNTGVKLDFGGMDLATAKQISEWAGDNTVTQKTRSRPRWGVFNFEKHSESEAERGRRHQLPQELRRLGRKWLLARRGNLELFKLRRIVWYKDRHFRRMAGDAPPVPSLAVTVERDSRLAAASAKKPAWAALP